MWRNDFNAVEPQFCVDAVGVIALSPIKVSVGRQGTTISSKVDAVSYFMGSGALGANRDWQPVTISNRHDLCSFAALCFSTFCPHFRGGETGVDKCFAEIDCASDTACARAVMTRVVTPNRTHR
jgi:hypothetical protein